MNLQFTYQDFLTAISPEEVINPAPNIEINSVAYDSRKLLPNSMKSLDLIAEDLKANPNLKLEIIGHNDEMEEKLAAEKPAFSDMSNKRINEVIKYLTSKGIAESRLISNPVGISDPSSEISDIDEEDLRLAKNR